ncbi:MAG: TonB-dependent receptor [Dysgonamonadaceae bacterium]|jgi:TonB-linked SusC/RagA family outer membrane protein|nr:TonB-dependent receptor [Dysgonamonadaceae bacterium]
MKKTRKIHFLSPEREIYSFRRTMLTLFFALSTLSSFGINHQLAEIQLSLKLENATIQQVIGTIEQQTGYVFLYKDEIFDRKQRYSVDFQQISFEDLLKSVCETAKVDYEIRNDRQIILKERSKKAETNRLIVSQNRPVTGVITDAKGIPVAGASVMVKGTQTGTVTNEDGVFSLPNIPTGATLVCSFLGMKTQEVIVGTRANLSVVLQEDAVVIDEVVAIGYGIQKRATVTGSVASVQGGELVKMPSTNLAQSLTGRMTGVIVNTRGSAPGTESVDLYIRGKSSWQGGSPLIIIDGIANRSGFERLNPNDIESISVLKDASAAIYGSRAANGVILITTKHGKEGKPTIEYTGDYGLTAPTRVPEMARSWQNATYFTEAKRSGYIWTDDEIAKFKAGSDPNLYPNYDLRDYILADFAPQTTHTISLRGGNNNVKYYLSGRYLYKASFFKDGIDDYNSYQLRANVDAQVTNNFSVGVNVLGRRDDVMRALGSSTMDGVDVGFFEWLSAYEPTKPILYENGLPAPMYGTNLVEMIKGKSGTKDDRTNTINSQFTARWDLPFITKGLFLEGTAAYDYANVRTKQFSNSFDFYQYDNSTGEYTNLNVNPTMSRSLYDYYYNSYRYTLNGKLGYEQKFGDHNINAFVAYEQYSIDTEWISASRSTFLSDQIPYLFAGDANTQKNDGSGSEYAYRNMFGRFAYTYMDKYMLDFTLRRDESLKFPENKRVGWFPGLSAGWRLSEEQFMKEQYDFVDNLKLRASWGQMGSDNVGDFQYLATATLNSTFDSYVLGNPASVVSTLSFSGTPNTNISWEVANTYNAALEGSLWNGLLGFELEYFFSKRSNILATRNASVPVYTGMTLPAENIGKAQNKGFEIVLSHARKDGDLSYKVSGNFSYNANKIIYMDESPNVPDYQRREGHPIDSYLLYLTDGIFNTQEEFDATTSKRAGAQLGDIKYLNRDDIEAIDNLDMVRLYESSIPKMIFGLIFDASWKGFDLNILWQGQAGAKTYVNPTIRNGDINIPMWMYENRWTPENAANATMPRAFYHRSESYNTLTSDFWLRDASFLRLKSLELGYNLPANIARKASCKNVRLYVSGLNLLLFDKIKDYDPEIVNTVGVFYPATKVYNFGVNLTF